MLQFFREKKQIIGWGIVIFFVGTMFTGSVFLGKFGDLFSKQSSSKETQPIAYWGKTVVPAQKYMMFLNRTLGRFKPEDIQHLDPEVAEFVQYAAFSEALQFTILLDGAHQAKMKVSSSEMDQAFESVYRDYDVKGMKELKALLKKSNYPLDQFKDDLKDDLLTQKFANSLVSNVAVTSQDLQQFPTADPKTISQKILQAKQQQTARNYVQQATTKYPITVLNPILKAYHGKAFNDVSMAVGAYQTQISNAPASPIPHYLLAKLYMIDKKPEEAQKELEKAKLKIELNKVADFPALHLFLAKIAEDAGKSGVKQDEYQKAFDLCGTNDISLRQTLEYFKDRKETAWAGRIEAKLNGLAQVRSQTQAANQPPAL
jgi:hypothetical protein